MSYNALEDPIKPLKVDEVISFLKKKWGVSYEMRIAIRGKNIFLHIMWGYLEQRSFPLNEQDFRKNLSLVIVVLNRLGQSMVVRNWLIAVKGRPKLGKALSLRLQTDHRLEEFVL